MLERSQSILKKFDFVSMKAELNYQGSSTVKNAVGGCLSLMMIVLFSIITIYFGLEIFEKKEPIVRTYDEFIDESKVYIKDFPVMFYAAMNDGSDFFKKLADSIEIVVESRVVPSDKQGFNVYNEKYILDRCQVNFMSAENWTRVISCYNLDQI